MSDPCLKSEEFQRIHDELTNHKSWRKETTSLLNDIALQVAAQTERLRYFTDKVQDQNNNRDRWDEQRDKKIDEHIKNGDAFRVTLFFTALALIASIVTGFVAYGRMEQKVDMVYQQHLGGK